MTTLTLTPDFDDKKLTVTGKVSVGEKVDVVVTGVTEDQSAHLRVRFRQDGTTVARYPLAAEDVWTYSGATATANMDLNTDLFRALFDECGDRDKIQCVIVVDNTDDQNEYAIANVSVSNWPAESGEDVPYSLSTYKDDVAELNAEMDQAQTDIDAAEALIGNHTHDGGTTVVIDHNNLGNKGTNTHPQIDATLTAISASLGTVSGEATGLRNDLDDVKAMCETAKAMPVSTAKEREARVAFLIQGLIDSL